MATRGKATKFTVEKAMLMLDSSFSGSELEGFESDDSLDGYWQNEENEQEAGCTDGGASHDSGGAEGETSTEPELTLADGGARSQSEGESDPESNAESEHEPPKSRKRVCRPLRWKKNKRIRLRNSGKEYTSSPGNKVIPPKCLSLHAHNL